MIPASMIPGPIVQSSVAQVFETMYFTDAAYCGSGPVEICSGCGSLFETSIVFSGPLTGRFRVVVSAALAEQMATDFLALDPGEATPEQIEAIVAEFANIACGATMSAWLPEANFHYSVPAPLTRVDHPAEFAHRFRISAESPDLAIAVSAES